MNRNTQAVNNRSQLTEEQKVKDTEKINENVKCMSEAIQKQK